MTNEQVMENFLDGGRPSGRNSTGSVYFIGDLLYSYGYHHVLARKGNNAIRVNSKKYSVTTSKQTSQFVRVATRRGFTVVFEEGLTK